MTSRFVVESVVRLLICVRSSGIQYKRVRCRSGPLITAVSDVPGTFPPTQLGSPRSSRRRSVPRLCSTLSWQVRGEARASRVRGDDASGRDLSFVGYDETATSEMAASGAPLNQFGRSVVIASP